MQRIRGFIDLVFDVVDETNNLVELTHDEVVARTVRRFAPVEPVKTVANSGYRHPGRDCDHSVQIHSRD